MSKRDIIYKAGIDEISKRGFFNTRVSDIVAAANLSTGTFYNYFHDKNDFLYSIFLDITTRLHNELKSISSLDESEIEKISLYIDVLLKEVSINTSTYRVYISEKNYLIKILDDEKLNVLNQINSQIDSLLTNIILAGQKKMLIKETDPNLIIVMIHSLGITVLLERDLDLDCNIESDSKIEMKQFILDAIKSKGVIKNV